MSALEVNSKQYSRTGFFAGNGFYFHSNKPNSGNWGLSRLALNVSNLVGYIPIISIFSGTLRLSQANAALMNMGSDDLKGKELKNAETAVAIQVLRGYAELLSVGALFLGYDVVITVLREKALLSDQKGGDQV